LRFARNPLKGLLIVTGETSAVRKPDVDSLRSIAQLAGLPTFILHPGESVPPLVDIAAATGGRYVAVSKPEEWPVAAIRVLVALRNSYALGFRPTNLRNDGSPRLLEVQYIPLRGLPRLNFAYPTTYTR